MADAAADAGAVKKPAVSKSARAGLTFAVSRIDKKLRHGRIAKQVFGASSVFLTGVVEHVIGEVLKKADEQAAARKSKRVTDQHIIARAFQGFCFSSDLEVPKAIDRILPQKERRSARPSRRRARRLRSGLRRRRTGTPVARKRWTTRVGCFPIFEEQRLTQSGLRGLCSLAAAARSSRLGGA